MLRPIGRLEPRIATAHAPVRQSVKWSIAIVLVVFASFLMKFAIIVAGGFNLSFDEAYYWHWSKQLDWCYFSKGPGIALLIRATTSILGDSELGVRAGALLCSTTMLVVLYAWTARFFQCQKTALLSVVFMSIAPFMMGLGVLTTIDSPLVLCWTLATVSFWKAIETRRVAWWLLTGLSVAAGTQFKFTMLFFVASMIAYALLARFQRMRILKGTGIAVAIVMTSLIPIIIWNTQHHWITFNHTATKASAEDIKHWVSWAYLLPSLVQQLGVMSPLLGVAVLMSLGYLLRDVFRPSPEPAADRLDAERATFLLAISAPVCLFYALLSFHRMVEANWMAVIYVTLVPATAYYWIRPFHRFQRWTLGATVVTALMIQMIIPLGDSMYRAGVPEQLTAMGLKLKPSVDPTNRLKGWELLGQKSIEHVQRLEKKTGQPVVFLTDHYSMAAWVGFYTKMPDSVFVLPHVTPNNQFDMWGTEGRVPPKGASGIFVYELSKGGRRAPYMFEEIIEKPDEVPYYRGTTEIKHFLFFFGENFKGADWWIPPEIFGSLNKS